MFSSKCDLVIIDKDKICARFCENCENCEKLKIRDFCYLE